jgi:hypothetical protein
MKCNRHLPLTPDIMPVWHFFVEDGIVSVKKLILMRAILAVALSPVLAVGALAMCLFVGMVGGVHIALPHLVAASMMVVILVSIVNWKCLEGCRAAKSLYAATYLLSLCAAFTIAWVFWHWLKSGQ